MKNGINNLNTDVRLVEKYIKNDMVYVYDRGQKSVSNAYPFFGEWKNMYIWFTECEAFVITKLKEICVQTR